jgi:hypothetical protein
MKWLVSIRSMRLLGVIRASPRVPHIFLPKTTCFPTPKRVLGEKKRSSSKKKIKILLPHAFSCTIFFFCRELATPSHLGRRRFLLSSRGLRRGARHQGGRPTDCRGLPSVKEQVTTTSREVFKHGCHLRWQRSSPRPLLRCCLLTVSLT